MVTCCRHLKYRFPARMLIDYYINYSFNLTLLVFKQHFFYNLPWITQNVRGIKLTVAALQQQKGQWCEYTDVITSQRFSKGTTTSPH